jgi:arylsulfatase A-like enzyme
LYQVSHGVADENFTLPDSVVTLAEVLRNDGYTTAGFISGPYMKRLYGFHHGFDSYEESVSAASNILSHSDITSPRLTDQVLAWLRENGDRKFFLFVHWWDPHSDYIPPHPYDRTFDPDYTGTIDGTDVWLDDRINPDMDARDLEHLIALYDGEILWTDKHLAKVFEHLEESGLMENTVVVIVGDHGEEFFEHGGKGHRVTLYNEVIHVPLIMKVPRFKAPRTISTGVSVVDIMPTLLELLEVPGPSGMEGKSLIPLIDNESGTLHDAIYSQLSSDIAAIIEGDWKYIYNIWDRTSELYNLKTDFAERHNVHGENRELAISLHQKMWNWITTKLKGKRSAPEAQIDEETLQQLKSLGYIQ